MTTSIPTFQNRSKYSRIPVGFCGFAGSGKDTVAGLLMRHALAQGFPCQRLGLADEVKNICAKLYGFSYEQCYGSQKDVIDPRYGFTPRFAFQRMGTEVARSIYADTWVDFCLTHLESGFTCIPDVRFDNEAAKIRAHGGVIIGVERKSAMPTVITHESEQYAMRLIETAEIRVDNNTSLDNLKAIIPSLFDHLTLLTGVPNASF